MVLGTNATLRSVSRASVGGGCSSCGVAVATETPSGLFAPHRPRGELERPLRVVVIVIVESKGNNQPNIKVLNLLFSVKQA